MKFPSEEKIKELREQYPVGTRIKLLSMDDPQAPPSGSLGTVRGVDDSGGILMNWDSGGSLKLFPDEDKFEITEQVIINWTQIEKYQNDPRTHESYDKVVLTNDGKFIRDYLPAHRRMNEIVELSERDTISLVSYYKNTMNYDHTSQGVTYSLTLNDKWYQETLDRMGRILLFNPYTTEYKNDFNYTEIAVENGKYFMTWIDKNSQTFMIEISEKDAFQIVKEHKELDFVAQELVINEGWYENMSKSLEQTKDIESLTIDSMGKIIQDFWNIAKDEVEPCWYLEHEELDCYTREDYERFFEDKKRLSKVIEDIDSVIESYDGYGALVHDDTPIKFYGSFKYLFDEDGLVNPYVTEEDVQSEDISCHDLMY